MHSSPSSKAESFQTNSPAILHSEVLEPIATSVRTVAQTYRGDCLSLLTLLRLLEGLHCEIRDTLFQESLPHNRQALYALLRDIEADGGWPYIHRMKLQALLANWPAESDTASTEVSPSAAASESSHQVKEPGN